MRSGTIRIHYMTNATTPSVVWSNTATVIDIGIDIRDDYIAQYSDMYKDAYGFRPRFDYSNWSLADFEKEFEYLGHEIKRRIEADDIAYDNAAVVFENRVANTIALGAGSRENAIRWIMDADNADGDFEYLAYLNGLRYGYFRSC